MRLRDLDAKFLGGYDAGNESDTEQDTLDGAQGVMFQCPACAKGKERGEEIEDGQKRRFYIGAHYVICWFKNPINAQPVPNDAVPGPGRWETTGSSIDNLTLNPSVHLSGAGCGWHGWVKNGEAA